jgi:hypothetical protein
MTPSEIITADLQRRGEDPKRELVGLAKAVKLIHALILQEGNTIMVLLPLSKDSAEMKMYSADTPLRILSAIKVFMKKLEDSELSKVYFNITAPQNLTTMKRLGVQVENSDKEGYNFMAII